MLLEEIYIIIFAVLVAVAFEVVGVTWACAWVGSETLFIALTANSARLRGPSGSN